MAMAAMNGRVMMVAIEMRMQGTERSQQKAEVQNQAHEQSEATHAWQSTGLEHSMPSGGLSPNA
jgi:hypothetical protein